ncbi:MAG: tetratricopeptide repeat protein [Symploca sp. SIO2E9]|nr:tetratricopeptide repeat protein [Symploca sp. SIO2E9]
MRRLPNRQYQRNLEYQQLLEKLLAGVSQGWNQALVLEHLGSRVDDRFFRAWLRDYGGRLRQLPEANHQLAWQLVRLSRVGCGEIGEIAAEIGRDLLSKPAIEDEVGADLGKNPIKSQAAGVKLTPNTGGERKGLGEEGDLQHETAPQSAPTISLSKADIDQAEAWFNQGYQQAIEGDFLAAVASYDKALQFKPDYHQAWNNRGLALYDLGLLEEAISSYDQALNFQPDFLQAWNNRGLALHDLGLLEEAISSYDQALNFQPDYHQAWYNRGLALSDLGLLEEAISSYDQALNFQPDYHQAWYNRGLALSDLGLLEEAISSYDQALNFQPDYHQAWYNRGLALSDLGLLEEAISSYDQALNFKPDLHQVWYSRGNALYKLGLLEEAISSYDQALNFKPDYHQAWNNRGNALYKLGLLEEAISSYDQALNFKPDLHQAWNSRGLALYKLGLLEEAISSYDQALNFKPDDDEVWYSRGLALSDLGLLEEAISSYNQALNFQPDYHQAWNNRGLALYKLGLLEEAISSYDQALNFKPDLHQAWLNRGIAAGESPNYNPQAAIFLRRQFPASTPLLPNPALTQRSYKGKLLSFQEGLKHCPQSTHPEGWGMLHLCIGNAHYFQGRWERNYREYWYQAVDEYHQALITLTAETFPELHLEVLQKLIPVLFGLGRNTEAKQWRREGLEVWRQLLNSQKTSFQKRRLEAKFISFSQIEVDVLVEDGELVQALEAAERHKNRYLTWILNAQKENILSPSYAEIQQLLNPTTAIVYWHLSSFALNTFIIKNQSTKPIVIKPSLPNSSSTSEELTGIQQLEAWVNNWDRQYQDYRSSKEKADYPLAPSIKREVGGNLPPSWRDSLPEMLKQLRDILDIPAILSAIKNESIQNLILIPHRDLHRFPLHALFPDNFTITYLPSAQIGINLRQQGDGLTGANDCRQTTVPLLSVEHPNSEDLEILPYAEIESAAIIQLFNNHTRIVGNNAEKQRVVDTLQAKSLKNGHSIFHFTGHGDYNFQRPKQSALALSGKDKLTLEEICQLNLSGYQLVNLAACETALTGKQTIDEEYVGLVSAFLYHGVTNVISTLWTVTDYASSLLMIYFYWQLKKGKSPAVALAKATKWLRNLTDYKLERMYKVIEQLIIARLPPDEKPLLPHLRNELLRIQNMELSQKKQKLFEKPYYWAAFTITGSRI